jgi:hypothetical protein
MTQAQHDIARKLRILNHAKHYGNVPQTCRYFSINSEKSSIGGNEYMKRTVRRLS